MWLHAHGVPGAHVIVRCGGAPVAEETLLLAARLAAHYSSARAEPRVQVDFTARRHVHHMPGGRPGMVIYTHESTLVVAPGDLEPPDEDPTAGLAPGGRIRTNANSTVVTAALEEQPPCVRAPG